MNKEIFGILLGIAIIIGGAWILSLICIGYVIGDLNPFHWNAERRAVHLILQTFFVATWFITGHFRRG